MSTWFSPGRIEVLGKHTDYAGGRCLVMALDRGVTASFTPGGRGIHARSTAMPDAVDVHAGPPLPAGHWGRYLQTAVARLEHNFGPLTPGTITLDSTLPLASGMSSSSAVVVAATLALAHDNGLMERPRWRETLTSPEALATYLACVENGSGFGPLDGHPGVGTHGGSEDHTAMICSRDGELGVFDFADQVPTQQRRLRLPDSLAFVVIMSGVLAEKTGPALALYNRASRLAREAVDVWNAATGRRDANLGQALRSDADARAHLSKLLLDAPALSRRVEQFLTESTVIIPRATDALAANDLSAFRSHVDASQRGAEEGLGNQIPETSSLYASALALGAHAASAFGAGYGGSVWALVGASDAESFASTWLDTYRSAFPHHRDSSSVLVTRPSGGVHERGSHLAG